MMPALSAAGRSGKGAGPRRYGIAQAIKKRPRRPLYRFPETIRAGQRGLERNRFTAGPEVAIGSERTNVFAARAVAKQKVESEH